MYCPPLRYGVVVSGSVGGDATVTGYEIALGPVAGNLRVVGAEAAIGPVGGYALLVGSEVSLNGAIAGDTVLVADRIVFGSGASVAGALTIYAEKPESIVVPASVAPADRIRIEVRKNYKEEDWAESMPVKVSLWRVVAGFMLGVLISGLLAALVIAVAPKAVQSSRELALGIPVAL